MEENIMPIHTFKSFTEKVSQEGPTLNDLIKVDLDTAEQAVLENVTLGQLVVAGYEAIAEDELKKGEREFILNNNSNLSVFHILDTNHFLSNQNDITHFDNIGSSLEDFKWYCEKFTTIPTENFPYSLVEEIAKYNEYVLDDSVEMQQFKEDPSLFLQSIKDSIPDILNLNIAEVNTDNLIKDTTDILREKINDLIYKNVEYTGNNENLREVLDILEEYDFSYDDSHNYLMRDSIKPIHIMKLNDTIIEKAQHILFGVNNFNLLMDSNVKAHYDIQDETSIVNFVKNDDNQETAFIDLTTSTAEILTALVVRHMVFSENFDFSNEDKEFLAGLSFKQYKEYPQDMEVFTINNGEPIYVQAFEKEIPLMMIEEAQTLKAENPIGEIHKNEIQFNNEQALEFQYLYTAEVKPTMKHKM